MDKTLLSLAGATATGALALISPSGWTSRSRRAYVLVPGALVTVAGALLLARGPGVPESVEATTDETEPAGTPPADPSLPPAVRVVLSLGLGALTCGVQAGSLWVDGAIESWLVRRGAARPRWWMAGLAVFLSLAIDAAGAGAARRARDREQLGRPGAVTRQDAP